MTTTKNLLVELFVEELPPKSLKKLGEAFAHWIRQGLIDRLLVSPEEKWEWYASPRRLAVRINNVESQQHPRLVTEKLMPVSVAYDAQGKPTQALLKRAKAKNFREEDFSVLQRRMEGNTEVLIYQWTDPGFSLEQVFGDVLEEAFAKLPIAKVMAYQLEDGWDSVGFVRPAHRLVVLHGAEIVDGVRSHNNKLVLGLKPGRTTQGHRFEAASTSMEIRDADSYETQMENEGAVIPSFEKRRAEIVRQLAVAAAKVGGGVNPIEDDALLDEVTALVERPNVLLCQFDAEFLEVPQECLILTMKANQKYFPLLDRDGLLTNKFLIVSNITPKDASLVIGGNERVVRPRLADAKFFYDQDRKKPLDSRVLGLAKVVYHNKLGTLGERVQRVQAIARAIGQQLGGEALARQADQAALLAKADLLTDMVGEFPELQGVMGRYYAQHDGLSDDIAFAIEDHYKPRFAGDELPRNMVGICVALADKLETLVGMFGIGQIPTGDKDPFALRRHALGVIRMLIEKELELNLGKLIDISSGAFEGVAQIQGGAVKAGSARFEQSLGFLGEGHDDLTNFIFDRMAGTLREQGYSPQEVDAVISLRPQRLSEVPKRLSAVRAFAALPEAVALAAANKRVGNILKKEGIGAGVDAVNSKLLKEPAEQTLYQALSKIAPKADAAFNAGDYTGSLQALAALRAPVDDFFDSVMVNAEDAGLRANRLALLSQLHQAMNRVADISKLAA